MQKNIINSTDIHDNTFWCIISVDYLADIQNLPYLINGIDMILESIE